MEDNINIDSSGIGSDIRKRKEVVRSPFKGKASVLTIILTEREGQNKIPSSK